MGLIQPNVLPSVSNRNPSGIVPSVQFGKGGVFSPSIPMDGGPEIPEPLPSPKPSPTKPKPIYGLPNGGHPVNQSKNKIVIGANTNYQLGKQGTVGGQGGSYQLGYGRNPLAVQPATTGRASGALTNGGWTYGAGSAGYSGGATGSSFSGLPTDRGRR